MGLRLLLERLVCNDGGEKKGYGKLKNITMDMLCSLPAEEVWKIGKMSKGLCDLIQSPDFASKYLERSDPSSSIAFLQCRTHWPWQKKFFYLDGGDNNKRVLVNGSPLLKKFPIDLVASCNGLLLFESPANLGTGFNFAYYIWNPVTQQVVNLTCPATGRIYGLYYHSSTNEYRLLYLRKNTSTGFVKDYGIIKAGENAGRGRRLHLKAKYHHRIPYRQSLDAPTAPVVVKNRLYWMAETEYGRARTCKHSIIGFDTDAEELFTLPHPDDKICKPSTRNYYCHRAFGLLHMEGRLTCWCLGVASAKVWILNDENYTSHNSRRWSLRKCYLNFDRDFRSYPFLHSWGSKTDIRLVSFRDDEVLLVWSNRGVFRYNLSTGNARKVDLKGIKLKHVFLVAHTPSVVVLEHHNSQG